MLCLRLLSLASIVSLLLAGAAPAAVPLFDPADAGEVTALTTGGATVSRPETTQGPAGAMAATVSYALGMDPDAAERQEAEGAELLGTAIYEDPMASAGRAVGGFGDEPNEAIRWANVGPAEALSFLYTNGTGRDQQASLYVNGDDVATLRFPRTQDWYGPYSVVRYEQPVEGTVALRVDEDDFAANNGTFCGNIDALVPGEVRSSSATIEYPLEDVRPEPGQRWFAIHLNATPGLVRFTVVDDAGAGHTAPPMEVEDDGWQLFTLELPGLDPPLVAGTAVDALRIEVRGEGLGETGEIEVAGVLLSDMWPSNPPAGCPLEPSELFAGVTFTGEYANYTQADTWYPSWASDGNLYSPYTDGSVDGIGSNSSSPDAATGQAIVMGDDPMNLTVDSLGVHISRPWPYATRYPCGTLVHDGVWYFGTYIINGDGRPAGLDTYLGPFVGFRTSTDYGKTWTETPCTPLNNLFDEEVDKVDGGWSKIKMGSPHFVDFGRNMEHSPDGKAYVIAHGCTDPASRETWIQGDQIYIARVVPSIETINDEDAWEYYAGTGPDGEPRWSDDFEDIAPLFEWKGLTGCVTATWVPGIERYLMFVSTGKGVTTSFDTYVLEAERIEGPWRLVSYMEKFGQQAYFVNVPSKFIDPDGHTMWLSYSANWNGGHKPVPMGGSYAFSLHEMKLIPRD